MPADFINAQSNHSNEDKPLTEEELQAALADIKVMQSDFAQKEQNRKAVIFLVIGLVVMIVLGGLAYVFLPLFF